MTVVLQKRLGDQLKTYIRAIESLEQEKQEIASAIKETLDEAKREGLDVKTLKRILSLRKVGRVDFEEQESTLHTYMSALGMR
jgi:uncharacterized protein (UPF0335 family)